MARVLLKIIPGGEMTWRCVALACVFVFAQAGEAKGKDRVTTDTFNEMIDANDDASARLTDKLETRPSRKRAAEFAGEVISEKAPQAGPRNPFRYNPFVKEDDVYVKGVHDDLEGREPAADAADLSQTGWH